MRSACAEFGCREGHPSETIICIDFRYCFFLSSRFPFSLLLVLEENLHSSRSLFLVHLLAFFSFSSAICSSVCLHSGPLTFHMMHGKQVKHGTSPVRSNPPMDPTFLGWIRYAIGVVNKRVGLLHKALRSAVAVNWCTFVHRLVQRLADSPGTSGWHPPIIFLQVSSPELRQHPSSGRISGELLQQSWTSPEHLRFYWKHIKGHLNVMQRGKVIFFQRKHCMAECVFIEFHLKAFGSSNEIPATGSRISSVWCQQRFSGSSLASLCWLIDSIY